MKIHLILRRLSRLDGWSALVMISALFWELHLGRGAQMPQNPD